MRIVVTENLNDTSGSPNNLTLEEVYQRWIEDSQALTIQKERIKKLIEDNHHLMSTISKLKKKLKASKIELGSMSKSICMLNSSTDDHKIMSSSKQVSNKRGVGFSQHGKRADKGESTLSNYFVPTQDA